MREADQGAAEQGQGAQVQGQAEAGIMIIRRLALDVLAFCPFLSHFCPKAGQAQNAGKSRASDFCPFCPFCPCIRLKIHLKYISFSFHSN